MASLPVRLELESVSSSVSHEDSQRDSPDLSQSNPQSDEMSWTECSSPDDSDMLSDSLCSWFFQSISSTSSSV